MSPEIRQEKRKSKKQKSAVPVEAPTFNVARLELYACLKSWVFARVSRPCTIPADCRQVVNGEEVVTYYHGLAVASGGGGLSDCGDSESTDNRIWFKKPPSVTYNEHQHRARHHKNSVNIGPVTILPPTDKFIPKPGDVLMGKTSADGDNKRQSKGHFSTGNNSDTHTRAQKQSTKFVYWYPFASSVAVLYSLVCNGTTLSESELRKDLNARYHKRGGAKPGDDDVWALARLVLFGNVRVFAEEHLRSSTSGTSGTGTDTVGDKSRVATTTSAPTMNLSCAPLQFVSCCSNFFKDESLWDAFVQLVPNAVKPRDVDSDDSSYLSENDDDDDDEGKPPPNIIKPLVPLATHGRNNAANFTSRRLNQVCEPKPHPFLNAISTDQHNFNYGYSQRQSIHGACPDPASFPSTSADSRVNNPGRRRHNLDYSPSSPGSGIMAYNPTSPAPASPAYNPTSPAPASPAYNPTSPAPASPAYNPTSPRPFWIQPRGSEEESLELPPLPVVAPPPVPTEPPVNEDNQLPDVLYSDLFDVGVPSITGCHLSDTPSLNTSLNTSSLLDILRNVAAIQSQSINGTARL